MHKKGGMERVTWELLRRFKPGEAEALVIDSDSASSDIMSTSSQSHPKTISTAVILYHLATLHLLVKRKRRNFLM